MFGSLVEGGLFCTLELTWGLVLKGQLPSPSSSGSPNSPLSWGRAVIAPLVAGAVRWAAGGWMHNSFKVEASLSPAVSRL